MIPLQWIVPLQWIDESRTRVGSVPDARFPLAWTYCSRAREHCHLRLVLCRSRLVSAGPSCARRVWALCRSCIVHCSSASVPEPSVLASKVVAAFIVAALKDTAKDHRLASASASVPPEWRPCPSRYFLFAIIGANTDAHSLARHPNSSAPDNVCSVRRVDLSRVVPTAEPERHSSFRSASVLNCWRYTQCRSCMRRYRSRSCEPWSFHDFV